jgi:membrane-bound serine protease (ClpP class)
MAMTRFGSSRNPVGNAGVALPGGLVAANRRCRLAGLLALLLSMLGMLGISGAPALSQSEGPIVIADIKGAIGFVSAAHLTKALDKAKAEKARALVLRIDTPGGLVSTTRDMIQVILASPVPVVMYVAPSGARAASAGTYLMYAAHVAAMAPGTHLGAATPIPLGVPGSPSPTPKKPSDSEKPSDSDPAGAAGRKSLNDAIAYIRSLAQLRGRNADWAEKAVRDAATLTADEALKENVIEYVVPTVGELLVKIDGRTVKTAQGDVRLDTKGVRLIEHKADWKMNVMSAITDPNVAFLLLLVGVYGIILEFMHPGSFLPGVVGGISLLVALTALSVLPVNYGGLALLVLGIALMLVEAFTPGFGIVGLGGLASFVLGALFLFDPGDADMDFAVAWPLVAIAAATSALFFFGVAGFAWRARSRPVRTGAEEMIGSVGEVVSWDSQQGRILVHGEIWMAKAEASLAPGQAVRVVSRSGLTLHVQPAT